MERLTKNNLPPVPAVVDTVWEYLDLATLLKEKSITLAKESYCDLQLEGTLTLKDNAILLQAVSCQASLAVPNNMH
jgi:hypothetical protein